jgi:hypothetical protein
MLSDDEIKGIGIEALAAYKALAEAMADGSELARKELLKISLEHQRFAKDLAGRKLD